MRRSQKRFSLLALVPVILLALAYPAVGQVNRYERDGLSFSYPGEWPLTDESDAQVQSLSLYRGKDEAKIIIVSLRQQMNPEEIAQAQPKVTEAIVANLTEALQKLGAQVQRGSMSGTVGGIHAQGISLRATLHGEAGNADVYQLVLGGRLVNLVFVGSDQERLRAASAWNMICSTLAMGTPAVAPPPQSATPEILSNSGPVTERLLFQDNFQRADSTWVGAGWREYTRRNDQVRATDSPWRIRNGTLYFEAVGTNSYIEDFIETAASFPVDNVRVEFELRASVATSQGYVGPSLFWSGNASDRGGASNVSSGPGHIGVAAFNSWETGGTKGLVISTHGGARVYQGQVLGGVNQPGFSSISITVQNGRVTYQGANSSRLTLQLSQPLSASEQRHWTFGARLYDAGVPQVIEIRNLKIIALR